MTVPVFPVLSGLSFPVHKIPNFNNTRLATNWGRRSVFPNRVLPTWTYELQFELLRSAIGFLEFQQLLNVYLATYGGARYFAFLDPDDNSVTNQPFGTGDGTTTQFELVRTLTGVGFAEPVRNFVTTSISVAGVVQSSGVTIDTAGLLNFSSPPGNGTALTWTGQYRWLCRFDDDSLPLSKFTNSWWECSSVKFTTDLLG